MIRKEVDVFRTLDPEDEEILEAYAKACDDERKAKTIKDSLKKEVGAIITREDTEKTLVHAKFAYSLQYRRKWNPKMLSNKREIDVNGQYIEASVNDLKDAARRLTKVVQIPEMEDGHSIAISATRGV